MLSAHILNMIVMSCRFFTTDLSGGFKLSAGRISIFSLSIFKYEEEKTTNNKIIEDHKELLLNFFYDLTDLAARMLIISQFIFILNSV